MRAVSLGGGEHAGCTVISMHVPKVRLANDAYAAQLNAALPAEVRVVAVDSVLSDFDAGAYCTKLVYEALVPLPLLTPLQALLVPSPLPAPHPSLLASLPPPARSLLKSKQCISLPMRAGLWHHS